MGVTGLLSALVVASLFDSILLVYVAYILFSIMLLGAFFLFLQYNEYYYGSFTLAYGLYDTYWWFW